MKRLSSAVTLHYWPSPGLPAVCLQSQLSRTVNYSVNLPRNLSQVGDRIMFGDSPLILSSRLCCRTRSASWVCLTSPAGRSQTSCLTVVSLWNWENMSLTPGSSEAVPLQAASFPLYTSPCMYQSFKLLKFVDDSSLIGLYLFILLSIFYLYFFTCSTCFILHLLPYIFLYFLLTVFIVAPVYQVKFLVYENPTLE